MIKPTTKSLIVIVQTGTTSLSTDKVSTRLRYQRKHRQNGNPVTESITTNVAL